MELRFGRAVDEPVDGTLLVPAGTRVAHGRLTLPAGMVRPSPGPVLVRVGLRSVCWVGLDHQPMPDLGRLLHQVVARLDVRRRLVLDRRIRRFLGVIDASAFDIVVVALPTGGALLVPVEDFDARVARVSLP